MGCLAFVVAVAAAKGVKRTTSGTPAAEVRTCVVSVDIAASADCIVELVAVAAVVVAAVAGVDAADWVALAGVYASVTAVEAAAAVAIVVAVGTCMAMG